MFLFWLVVISVIAIILSTSRSGWVILGITVSYYFVKYMKRRKKMEYRRFWKLVAFFFLIMVILIVVFYSQIIRFIHVAFILLKMAIDVNEPSSTRPRLTSTILAIKVFAKNPVMGVGLGGYGAYVKNWLNLSGDPYSIVTSNLWAELLAELGIFGFLTFLCMIIKCIKNILTGIKLAQDREIKLVLQGIYASIIVTFFLTYQFNQTLYRGYVWLLLSLGAVFWRLGIAEYKNRNKNYRQYSTTLD